MGAVWVRDHIPLEQGLRQAGACLSSLQRRVRDHIPLEQGLRPLNGRLGQVRDVVSETIFH